jgi:hypothetical protein
VDLAQVAANAGVSLNSDGEFLHELLRCPKCDGPAAVIDDDGTVFAYCNPEGKKKGCGTSDPEKVLKAFHARINAQKAQSANHLDPRLNARLREPPPRRQRDPRPHLLLIQTTSYDESRRTIPTLR